MFHCFYSDKSYSEIYQECTGYKVVDDKQLPTKLCNLCETNLLSVWNFQMKTNVIESFLHIHYEANGFNDFIEVAEELEPNEIELEDIKEEESQLEVDFDNDSRYELVVQDVEIEANIENIDNHMENVVFEEEMFTEETSEQPSENENDPDAEQDPENEEYLDDEEYDQEQHKKVILDVEHAFIPSKDGISLECIVCGPSQCRQLTEDYEKSERSERSIQCGFCSKTFKDKKVFYNHQKIHFGNLI